MKNLILAAGFMAAAFAVVVGRKRKKHSRVMTFRELYEDNDVELEWLLNG
ncbi:MAG: LPXTG cell wall anchor domain-containing protein [Ruminococcaceae bacterium]|nr:LPXTG cell wall anchor domain-containing protein [Oscillospiraceae bacterium]